MDIKELFSARNSIIEENRKLYRENEKLKSTILKDIIDFNESQNKIREIFYNANEKLKGYKAEVKYIDHLINFLNEFRLRLVKSIDEGEIYIKTLKKPEEYKSFCVDIPTPLYTSTKEIEEQIAKIITKQ